MTTNLEGNPKILLEKIKEIYNEGWIKTKRKGDTGVGYTLETKLGISANSKKTPDFRGIEIKSFRERTKGKLVTLFSQVPNWKESKTDRSEILSNYGYEDQNKRFNLYCSVFGNEKNSLNWKLKVDRENKKILAINNDNKVTFWNFDKIEKRITEKHKESFFVFAQTKVENNFEYFLYNKVIYATNASLENFLNLIEKGKVCQDFVMHKKDNGSTRDHGFLWRIRNTSIPNLFENKNEIELG